MVSTSHLFITFLLIMISYKFTLCHGDQTQEKECETLDLALNIRESKKETFNYYKLPNDKMIYDETNQYLSFYPIEKSTIYNTLELSPLSNFSTDYTFRVFEHPTSDNLDENETPLEILKLKEPQKNDDIVSMDLNPLLIGKSGVYYINILAEVKMDEENVYNYLYPDIEIKLGQNELPPITILRNKIGTLGINNTNFALITADIDQKITEEEFTQYKFIKLNLKNNNNNSLLENNEIYASRNNNIFETKELNEKSEYKAINNYKNTILPISLANLKYGESLYIVVPCRETCNYTLEYTIEDGRKIAGISIHDKTCFDITLNAKKNENLNYRFLFPITKEEYPLITVTSPYLYKYFFINIGLENQFLKESLYSGYSFICNYKDGYYEFHTFLMGPNITSKFQICHRVVKKDTYNDIILGQKVDSILRNQLGELNDCFTIVKSDKDEYDEYIFNYMSLSRNIKINFNQGESREIKEESGNIFFKPENNKFCLSQSPSGESITYSKIYSAITFQILGVKNNVITQNLNAPLINGISLRHNLKKDQILYYRLTENYENSAYIIINFENIIGKIDLYREYCNSYDPNCSFTKDELEKLTPLNNDNENNIYINDTINNDKDNITVYVVHCRDNENAEFCEYYIELSNEKSYKLLNQNRKKYFNLDNDNYNILLKTAFNAINKTESSFACGYYYYFELHVTNGKIPNIKINEDKESKFYIYDDKTIYYLYAPGIINEFNSIYFNITGESGTSFYVNHRYINNVTYSKLKYPFYILSDRQMHYNVLNTTNELFVYSFPKRDQNNDNTYYIISINGINSYLTVESGGIKYKSNKYHQIKVKASNTIDIKCENEGADFFLGEFVVSASKCSEDHSININVEFDGFYQYYEFNEDVKVINLYYDLLQQDLLNKTFLVNINKNSLKELNISYGISDGINIDQPLQVQSIYKYDEIFMINTSNLINNLNNHEFENDSGKHQYLILKITSSDTNTGFRIKTNIKNKFSYLSPENIELGYIYNNEPLYYYFDYLYKYRFYESEHEGHRVTIKRLENQHEVFLSNKGNAIMETITLDNPYNKSETYNNNFNINFDDQTAIYLNNRNDNYPEKNHFIYDDPKTEYFIQGCRIYLKVYLNENNDNNNNGLFSIYRHIQNETNHTLNVQLNTNIFGCIYKNDTNNFSSYWNYYFKTDISSIQRELIFSLNCKKCFLEINGDNFTGSFKIDGKSSIIPIEKFNNSKYLTYSIIGDMSVKQYYYFSLSDPDYTRYIEPLQPERCYGNCTFAIPLHKFYNYISDNNKETKIILFSPDGFQIKIYYDFIDMTELENDNITDFNLRDKSNYSINKLVHDLNVDDINLQEKYLRIHAISDEGYNFNLIMNEFFSSPNNEGFEFTYDFIYVKKGDEKGKENILIFKNDSESYYEISIDIISGKGIISLNKENEYELDYETQPSIKLFLDLTNVINFTIYSRNMDINNDFIYFINATKIGENSYTRPIVRLDVPKVYRIKYTIDENEGTDLFPIYFELSPRNAKKIFVNYRFIFEDEKRFNFQNTTEEIFNSTFLSDQNITNFKNIYYSEFMGGIISMDIKNKLNKEYIEFDIYNNKFDSWFSFKNILLEITPLYLDDDNIRDNKIYIPKNFYLQIEINETMNFVISEYDDDYKNIFIEIGNTTNTNIELDNNFSCKEISGKTSCEIINRDKNEYNIYITPFNVSNDNTTTIIFIRYISKKNMGPKFNINKTNIDVDKLDEKTNYYLIRHNNISIIKNDDSIRDSDLKIIYYIRIYDYLDFFKDNDAFSIINKPTKIESFRKEFHRENFTAPNITYNISFNNLDTKMFYVSIIGSVIYKNTIEYFAFEPKTFKIKKPESIDFEKNWITPLVIIILIFVFLISYITYKCIEKRKQKPSQINDDSETKNLIVTKEKIEDIKLKITKDEDDEDDED